MAEGGRLVSWVMIVVAAPSFLPTVTHPALVLRGNADLHGVPRAQRLGGEGGGGGID